jgi:hypothetical protein
VGCFDYGLEIEVALFPIAANRLGTE